MATLVVDTDGRSPEDVAREIQEARAAGGADVSDTVLPVAGASPYDVVVGTDLADRLPAMLGAGVQRVAVVFPERWPTLARPRPRRAGRPTTR